ncbi:MAG: LacI family DNA-binding transcriptional regulator [Lachnospiraceae bacterium]|nr:LacI family DNA-binding transcriptional regulator [Lachnospiraceae bacterium]
MTATIKDVAKKAGTSTATVSKVMNGSYSISQATIDKVMQAMEELNYHPNLRAKNFAKQSTKTVIFVTSIGKEAGFSNPHMFEIMCGLEHALSEKGYALIVKNISEEKACEYIKNAVETKQVDGFVIHASVISVKLDELIFQMSIPHLVIGNPNFSSHFCWIDIDNKLAGELAAKHLLEKGYQSLAFIGGREEDKISMHRLQGVLSVLNEHDVIVPKNYVQHGESDCDSGYAMAELVLNQSEKPDAIICANNYIAYGCVSALHDKEIQIPNEIGVVTFDDYPFSKILKPMLTVIDIDVFDMGVQAGKYILQKIRKPNLYVQSYITFPTLIIREST